MVFYRRILPMLISGLEIQDTRYQNFSHNLNPAIFFRTKVRRHLTLSRRRESIPRVPSETTRWTPFGEAELLVMGDAFPMPITKPTGESPRTSAAIDRIGA